MLFCTLTISPPPTLTNEPTAVDSAIIDAIPTSAPLIIDFLFLNVIKFCFPLVVYSNVEGVVRLELYSNGFKVRCSNLLSYTPVF
jgi:hypothetical protein